MLNFKMRGQRLFSSLLLDLAILVLPLYAASAQENKSGPIRLGVVVPKDLVRGEHASGAVVLNSGDYLAIPGLKVTTLDFSRKDSGTPALNNFQLQINGTPAQPASLPFSFTAADKLDIRITPSSGGEGKSASIPLTLRDGPLNLPQDFTAPPVSQFGSMAIIRGPFGGDCRQTGVSVNGQQAALIAESQRVLFYLLPETIQPGAAQIDLKDREHRRRLKTWVLGLQMSADRLHLMKGESTAFHVVITGAETIPPEAWSGSGQIPELVDVDLIRKLDPKFQPPGPASPGFLLLTIENASPGVVTMGHGEHVVLTFTRSSGGKLRYDGVLTSKQQGGFNVNAVLIPFLHEQQGENVGQGDTTQVADNTGGPVIGKQTDTGGGQGQSTTPGQSSTPGKTNTPGTITDGGSSNTPGSTGKTPGDSGGRSSTGGTNPSGSTPNGTPGTTTKPSGSTDKPGSTTTPENPKTPTTPGTPEIPKTPTTHTPTDTPTTHRDKEQDDCPQRGKGCVALVIDFSKDYSFEFDMSTIADKLGKAGCDTDYVTPAFKEVPKPSIFSTPSAAEIKTAEDHNNAEWDKVNAAIKKHREKVAKGVEIAIEITNGHGGEAAAGLPCGDVEPADWRGSYVRRDDFHQGNYKAANKNVCSWFAADLTCYGGLTPKVVDELENLTTATCKAASAIACGNHAGWEADGGMSSATSTDTCNNGNVWWQSGYVKDALEAEIKRRAAGQNANYSALIQQLHSKTVESTTARYTDRGYAKDHPPAHARGGYGEKSSDSQ